MESSSSSPPQQQAGPSKVDVSGKKSKGLSFGSENTIAPPPQTLSPVKKTGFSGRISSPQFFSIKAKSSGAIGEKKAKSLNFSSLLPESKESRAQKKAVFGSVPLEVLLSRHTSNKPTKKNRSVENAGQNMQALADDNVLFRS
eukprot:c16039_g1_i1.p1 GENE.c16039_g1_i1~~c16039_g1_i1.p1  ORF type:complete len:143 (+),score=59.62 c16039_g1_i1:147-575(+)